MISLEKLKILTPLQKLPKNVGDLGKLIAAQGFKKLPKVQKVAKSSHTAPKANCTCFKVQLLDTYYLGWCNATSEIVIRSSVVNAFSAMLAEFIQPERKAASSKVGLDKKRHLLTSCFFPFYSLLLRKYWKF